ncbi:GNAT family N-acetyltransferase [Allorhizobium taibaishanense]|uniref:GNAT family N-acetyltransferase n=1 Tax=Allorhizobium taibaishanense TaxID=887144 RepID=A0A1Q8ZYH4_9HYPH|nr:GNAT family N-acetyltransferase [Allorhizobium taibaishanense]MBB4008169.1 GNAT superfamily N-acetyltransferase [Allorhizobium taibaishanense]OLP47164.1 GNAT family N-acetyltransferase [Allorhizobium taibaishanense]
MNGFNGSFMLGDGLNLRLVRKSDQGLIFQLFMESRPWLSWADASSDFIRDLYEQQFKALRAGVESVYPDHLDFIIESSGSAAGRIIVDLGYADWRISELQVLKRARGLGIGSNVIKGLQAAATRGNLPLTLSTPMFGSNSFPLYQRLGFQVVQEQAPMYHLAWFPPGHPMDVLSKTQ